MMFASRWSAKTTDAHLIAIRGFEVFLQGKDFGDLSLNDVDVYRRFLLDEAKKHSLAGGLSRSTITHRVSHLRSFLQWLLKQDG